jgi:hypothetical protein
LPVLSHRKIEPVAAAGGGPKASPHDGGHVRGQCVSHVSSKGGGGSITLSRKEANV